MNREKWHCLTSLPVGELTELQTEIAAWSEKANTKQRGVAWQFHIEYACVKLNLFVADEETQIAGLRFLLGVRESLRQIQPRWRSDLLSATISTTTSYVSPTSPSAKISWV